MAAITQAKSGMWRAQVYVKGSRDSKTFRTRREAAAWAAQLELDLNRKLENRASSEKKIGFARFEHSLHDMLNSLIAAPNASGVYVLFFEGKVTYVGQSRNMLSRIASHSEKGRKFSHYYAMPYLPCDLDEREQFFIALLQPEENRTTEPRLPRKRTFSRKVPESGIVRPAPACPVEISA